MYKAVLLLLIPLLLFCRCTHSAKEQTTDRVKVNLTTQLAAVQKEAESMLHFAPTANTEALKQHFLRLRQSYKKIEWFTEYYAPAASRELNGPPLPEIELAETTVFPASGLQVMEEHLFPQLAKADRPELIRELKAFLSTLKRTQVILQETAFTPAHVFDACRQQIFRIIILGITGFDTPLSQSGIREAAVSLAAVQQNLAFFGHNARLHQLFTNAGAMLKHSGSFHDFDRLAFITRFVNPITSEMLQWQRKLQIQPLANAMALRATASSLFDQDAINADYFAGNLEAYASPEKINLGRSLFFDPATARGSRSCATCHQPERAFTDGLPRSAALSAGKFVARNAPTLLYAGLQHAQFYDMRAPTLEDQAMDVLANPDEMHTSAAALARHLNQSAQMRARFQQAFPNLEKDIRPRHVMIALATFIRSLQPFNSRFDRYMRGDRSQLSASQVQGFNLFMGKAKCGTCHFMPVFNGTAGPAFATTESEVLGVAAAPGKKPLRLDPDPGRYFPSKIKELHHAFKTPTLRNIAKTAPYMHNGAYQTLEEVIDFYDQGGGAGQGLHIANQTLSADPLHLSKAEKKAIIAFLHALSDD